MTATEFDEAISGLRATGASASASEIVRALDRHGREESELLDRYERFVEKSESPVAKYLVGLIADEERRHHRMLEELANTIAWGHFGDRHSGTLPTGPAGSGPDPELQAETRALLRHERQDRRHLRRLGRRIRGYGDVPLWRILIGLMLLDTEKHISILRDIEKENRRLAGGRGARARYRWRSLWV
jgi:hypothetical protein